MKGFIYSETPRISNGASFTWSEALTGRVSRSQLSSLKIENFDSEVIDSTFSSSFNLDSRKQPSALNAISCRALDVLCSVLALFLLAPLLLSITFAIRLTSPGPALFRQTRYGLNATPFEILKFRTMESNAGDPEGRRQTVKNDPRVTRVGTFLRRTSFDELPQLINVLRGEMVACRAASTRPLHASEWRALRRFRSTIYGASFSFTRYHWASTGHGIPRRDQHTFPSPNATGI